MSDNKSSYGLVFDGEKLIGEFDYLTSENSYGGRVLINLQLLTKYIICNDTGNTKELRFVFADEPVPNYIRIVESLGLGTVEGKFNSIDDIALYSEATFWKSPNKNLSRNLN